MKLIVAVFLAIIVISAPSTSNAKGANSQVGDWSLGINVGMGKRSAFVLGQDDLNFYVLPDVYYYGEKLFFDNGTLGYTLNEKYDLALSVITELHPYGFYFDQSAFGEQFNQLYIVSEKKGDTPLISEEISNSADLEAEREAPLFSGDNNDAHAESIAELHRPSLSLDAGLQVNWFMDKQSVVLKLMSDISGQDIGSRARLTWNKGIKLNDFGIKFGLGVDWLDEVTTNYFFAVDTPQVNSSLENKLSSSVNPFGSVTLHYPLTQHLNFILHAKYLSLDSSITKSSIIDKNYSLTQFIGLNYRF